MPLDFDTVVVNNTPYLKPFAFTFTKDNEEAKDLMQETVYKALVNSDKYNSGTNIKAWLYTIMRNIFINNYRKKSKHHIVSDANDEYRLNSNIHNTIQNQAIANINVKEINNAINKLQPLYKIPFMLYFEGYKYEEIANTLKEPMGTIKSRIHLARKMLKQQIELN